MIGNRITQLALLTMVAAAGLAARNMLGPLLESMRIALSLSDNQIAVLQGPTLALPLLASAVPIGLLIDHNSRVRVLLGATVILCAASMLTAFAPNFYTLIFARCIIGAVVPATGIAAYSASADLFAPEARGRATMIVMIGQGFGSAGAFALGGELVVLSGVGAAGWRYAVAWLTAFFIPVIALCFALREPPRTSTVVRNPSLSEVWPELWRYRYLIAPLLCGMALVGLGEGAVVVWAAPTFSRNFHLPPNTIGFIMGTVGLVCSVLGPVFGGYLADFCQRTGGPRRTLLALTALVLISAPTALFAVATNLSVAVALIGASSVTGIAINLVVTTLIAIVVPNELRGTCMTFNWVAATLFAFGFAPLSVSLLSGVLGGTAKLGLAVAIVSIGTSLFGVVAFAIGYRLMRDAETVRLLAAEARSV